jgi:hypothetical protein
MKERGLAPTGPASNARGVLVHSTKEALWRQDTTGGRSWVSICTGGAAWVVRIAADTGQRLGMVGIDNEPMALAAEIAKAGEQPDMVLEAAYGWCWAADVLADAGAGVRLAHRLVLPPARPHGMAGPDLGLVRSFGERPRQG